MAQETQGEAFRRQGDELRELTDGEHYFTGTANRGGSKVYLFSFGDFTDAEVAQLELSERLRVAREAQTEFNERLRIAREAPPQS
ncbi:hypothetical protein ACFP2T_43340 [Plantactinospora solaniradicis]|uniref:Uncharacterized protein n=1 Tax=Plantactinospora solaniradicis TaxID=1723736 RepID=A0ABW1KR30_9ACTN